MILPLKKFVYNFLSYPAELSLADDNNKKCKSKGDLLAETVVGHHSRPIGWV